MISIRTILFSAVLSSTVAGWQYFFTESPEPECTEPCFTTDVSAYQTVKGNVWMAQSPRDNLGRSLLSAVNGSSWEQWYFDILSDTADTSMVMCVSRDASYTAMGQGILRVEFFLLLPNGTRLGGPDFVTASRVSDCCGEIHGEWTSSDRSYTFTISKDFSRIDADIRRPDIKAKFSLDATIPPRYASGHMVPSDDASHEVSPLLRIAEIMPAGRAEFEYTLAGEESAAPRIVNGIGGHNRFWSSKDWFSIVKAWNVGRAVVGPYTISIWEDVSKLDGKTYQSSMLFKNGKPLVRATGSLPANVSTATRDYLLMSKRHGGSVHSSWGDMSTGWTLEFISPSRAKRWQFKLEHKTHPFELGLGENKGLSGYTETITGGRVGGEQFEGYGWTELVDLPETFSVKLMLQVWWQMVVSSGDPLGFLWQMAAAPFKSR